MTTQRDQHRAPRYVGMRHHMSFVGLSALLLLILYALLRLALLLNNLPQTADATTRDLFEAFGNGVRFDLQVVVLGVLPLLLALASAAWLQRRRAMRLWLVGFASLTAFLGIVELDFYREFNQRLNSLVFQYMKEDPRTVLSMIWHGYPVVRYLLAWAGLTWLLACLWRQLDRRTRAAAPLEPVAWGARLLVLGLCLALTVVAARGTFRQGSPLRWGDAFTTESMFANQLGLNGTMTLINAARAKFSAHRDNVWKPALPHEEALPIVRAMLLTPADTLVEADQAAVRRDYHPPQDKTSPVKNVVLILMESFAGHYVGALGGEGEITPNFDALAREGVLFTRFFSNGTHTHQGMFASIGCFPNLPGFEYLMQAPEGNHAFSGLPQLLGGRKYDNLYVYNGDFAWDNQSGFFGKQGVSNFIGRMDYVKPVVFDPTWGVSDQDMFDRAAAELAKKPADKPFYALLQSLSNHTPYPLPEKLPVDPVSGHGALDPHLTAMRYSDWALGQFFAKARQSPYYRNTLFVIVGDHGFAGGPQLTELNLLRFNVPLLLIAPGLRERWGDRLDTVATQVDIVPTIMGRLGGDVRHQCWGRDLLNLPAGDRGFGVIKPSGGDQTVGIVRDDKVLVVSKGAASRLYQYQLGATPTAQPLEGDSAETGLRRELEAFLQIATRSLLDNTTGVAPARR